MKYCLLLICIVLTLSATAQFDFKFYTQAGANYTTIRIPRTTGIETSNGGYGWQLGIGTEYHTKFGFFLSLGVDGRNESYKRDSISFFFPDTVTQYKNKVFFIGFPVGIGWQIPIDKRLSLKVYTGLNVQIGVAGKVNRRDLYYVFDSTTQQTVLTRTESSEHDMRFGRTSPKKYPRDLANSNWGIHVGTGINFNNSVELNVFYHHGLTNFLPNRDAAVEINKLSFFEVNTRIYFPNNFGRSKSKGRNGY